MYDVSSPKIHTDVLTVTTGLVYHINYYVQKFGVSKIFLKSVRIYEIDQIDSKDIYNVTK